MSLANLAPIPELYVSYDSAQKLKHEAGNLPSWDLTPRQVCDLELLMNGGFHPLKGFQTEADYNGTVENMRTADGTLWPIPVTLDVSQAFADKIEPGQDIALRDAEGVILAIMSVTDKWVPNKAREAQSKILAAVRKGGADAEGRVSIIQVRSSHALLEGSDSALLTRSQSASHGVMSNKDNKVSLGSRIASTLQGNAVTDF